MPRTHKGAIALLNKEVLQPGLLDAKWGATMSRLQQEREHSDYHQFGQEAQPANILEIHASVLEFVNVVRATFVPSMPQFVTTIVDP